MRTNIEIDDDLMKAAMEATGGKTKKETVELALRTVARRRHAYDETMKLYGAIQWDDDLDAMRRDK